MKDIYILGIETSCDETSASIVKNGKEDLGTVVLSQMDIHKDYGGVVPEIASRNHVENITLVIEETLLKAKIKSENVTAVAVTYGPGLVGSLLIGLQAAKTLSLVWNKPLIAVHHIVGHIYANNLETELKFPLVALVVSGGHTDLVYMKDYYHFETIGSTLDDAVGETYDKVAKVMGLDYPGGPIVDSLAFKGEDTYSLPIPLDDESYNFSFSGLKSAVINLINKEKNKNQKIINENLACSFQNRVIKILTKKTMRLLAERKVNNLILAGGVSANKGLREEFIKLCEEKNVNLKLPLLKYCTDNATMIATAGYFLYKKNKFSDLSLNPETNISLERSMKLEK